MLLTRGEDERSRRSAGGVFGTLLAVLVLAAVTLIVAAFAARLVVWAWGPLL